MGKGNTFTAHALDLPRIAKQGAGAGGKTRTRIRGRSLFTTAFLHGEVDDGAVPDVVERQRIPVAHV